MRVNDKSCVKLPFRVLQGFMLSINRHARIIPSRSLLYEGLQENCRARTRNQAKWEEAYHRYCIRFLRAQSLWRRRRTEG